MKKNLLLAAAVILLSFNAKAQGVTQINNNNSLYVTIPLPNGKTIVPSSIDSSLWATDGTLAGTVQISATIKFEDTYGLLNGKMIFEGSTPATGSEIFITDGTPGGTSLVKDINAGAVGSGPGVMALLNGFLYFSAETAAEGRELWRTDGTAGGTTLVKDILPGTAGSMDSVTLFSSGTYLLFPAESSGSGVELWKSDGTNGGTVLLKEINTANANADSSNPNNFYRLNSTVLFNATDATHGEELWKTDGTSAGTILLKDINLGSGNSTTFTFFGIDFPLFIGFHTFNNHAYFNAYDGTSTGELWVTDGTAANTSLLKDIVPGLSFSFVAGLDAVNLSNKFIFPVSDGVSRSELWESDGTPGGTVLFKAFSPINPTDIPEIFIPFSVDFVNGTFSQPLYQGNKFFFTAGTMTEGYELWISDGTLAGTSMVKDINSGTGNGIDIENNVSYLYTTTDFYFAANDGTNGNELWKTDGTSANTSMVADINPAAGNADPALFLVCNGKIMFTATDGDDPDLTDLFVVNGNFVALPVRLTDFTVVPRINDALLQWSTRQEINSKNYTVQRSYDGQHFDDIGIVNANGTTSLVSKYSFTDPGIMNSGKSIVYYRLKVLDKDGKSVLTNIISLKIKGNTQWSLKLLSNPVNDYVSLLLNDVSGRLQLSVRDIAGRIVYTTSMENVNGQVSLPVTLQKGMYILEAENNNERKILKFIK
jgi:ELWxxDGT repeat protein